MRSARRSARLLLVTALLAAAACGGKDGAAAAGDGAEASSEAAAASAAGATTTAAGAADPSAAAEAPLVVSDVDAYRRGALAEIEVLEKAVAKLREARSATDTMNAVLGASQSTDEDGAGGAGVPVSRYRTIKSRIDAALSARQMGESPMLKEMRNADTTDLTPEQRAQYRENLAQMEAAWGNPYKDFTPEVAEALKAQATQLDSLRAQQLRLRFQAAGQEVQ